MVSIISWTLAVLAALEVVLAGAPTYTTIDNSTFQMTNGGSLVVHFNSAGHAYSITRNGKELVNKAAGGYSDTGGKTTFDFASGGKILEQSTTSIHVVFPSSLADVHYVFNTGLDGWYQWVINNNLGSQGEVRSLYRFDPALFTQGRTPVKNGPLPTLADIKAATYVQDETFQRANGSYITKYDWSTFSRDVDFHGVYGDNVGAWIIAPGKDYWIGDHLKQEMTLHCESKTGDTVLHVYFHGSHYNSVFSNPVPTGKMWGPWLLYFNDGSIDDAANKTAQENSAWPYAWVNDTKFQNRGTVTGTLKLDDGRPAAGAAIFLGEKGVTQYQGETYQYTTYADEDGNFTLQDVRREKQYALQAWANGGSIGDVQTTYLKTGITIQESTSLGALTWATSGRTTAWKIGDFDRTSLGFQLGGHAMEHGLTDLVPGSLTYTIGKNITSDWWFAQANNGTWTVLFDGPPKSSTNGGVISISFSGYTSQNGYGLGSQSREIPEIAVIGLNVSVNGNSVGSISSKTATDGAVYRSATTCGGWYYQEFTVPASAFVAGQNKVDLAIVNAYRWHGIMWDAIKLEWA